MLLNIQNRQQLNDQSSLYSYRRQFAHEIYEAIFDCKATLKLTPYAGHSDGERIWISLKFSNGNVCAVSLGNSKAYSLIANLKFFEQLSQHSFTARGIEITDYCRSCPEEISELNT